MEVDHSDQRDSKFQLIKSLKNNVLNNNNHGEQVQSLIQYYLSKEKSSEFNGVSATCLILLLCISGDYQGANSRRSHYKNLKLFNSNEEFCQLFSPGKRFLKEPYLDLFGHIYFFMKSSSLEVSTIATAYLYIYERQQAVYLSKFYSKLKVSTLKKLLGQHYNEEKLGDYLSKYGWKRIDDYIVLSQVSENFDSFQLKEDLEFVNKMTVSLENIAKSNNCLRPSEA